MTGVRKIAFLFGSMVFFAAVVGVSVYLFAERFEGWAYLVGEIAATVLAIGLVSWKLAGPKSLD